MTFLFNLYFKQTVLKHPEYKSSTKKNDIALIKVSEPLKFDENLRPACLRTDLSDVSPDVELFVTGWGSISAESKFKFIYSPAHHFNFIKLGALMKSCDSHEN